MNFGLSYKIHLAFMLCCLRKVEFLSQMLFCLPFSFYSSLIKDLTVLLSKTVSSWPAMFYTPSTFSFIKPLLHTYSFWFSINSADTYLCLTFQRLLLSGSHLLTTDALSKVSSLPVNHFSLSHSCHSTWASAPTTPHLRAKPFLPLQCSEQFAAHAYFRG